MRISRFQAAMCGVMGLVMSMSLSACGRADLSTPKSAVRTFARAVREGNADLAKKAVTGADDKTVESIVKIAKGSVDLRDAAVAKFGDDGKKVFDGEKMNFDDQNITDGTEKIDGDKATVKLKNGDAIKTKKVNGEWKVDMTDESKHAPPQAEIDSMVKAMNQTTDEIKAGKYKTATEAQTGLGKNMMGIKL